MPLLWLSLAFLGGILLGEWLPWHWAAWLGLGVASLAAWIVLRRFTSPGTSSTWVERFARRMPGQAVPLAAVVLALAAGAGRYQLAHPAPTPGDIAWYNGSGTLVITGMVDEPPNRRESYTSLKVKVRQTAGSMGSSMPQAVRGRVMAILPATDDWQYGDLVELTGAPELPEASFSFTYRDYLARQGISAALYYPRVRLLQSGQGNPFTAAMYAFKQKALRNLEIILPTPEAELLQGIILGVDENIPKDLAQDYITTGTAHIIAISGFNIAILSGVFAGLFTRLLGRRWGMLAALIAIALYSLLVGAGASVVRAAIMGAMGLLGAAIGRRQAGANSLAFTAALMCLVSPDLPWDVSFQLSFAATLGLVLYAQPLQDGFILLLSRFLPPVPALRMGELAGEYLLFTVAAQATTLPIILYHFQRISLVSPLANLLVLPAQPAVMILGGLATLASMVYLPLGRMLGYLAWPFTAYTNRVVAWLAAVPQIDLNLGQISLPVVLFLYIILFSATFVKDWRACLRRAISPQAAIAITAVLAVLVWSEAASLPDRRLHLVLLPTGDGTSLLIQSPSGRAVLVNGGSDASALKQAVEMRQPLFERRLDYLVVASTRSDNIRATATLLTSLPCAAVLWNGPPDASQAARELEQFLEDNAIPITQASTGQRLELGSGATLSVAAADETGTLLVLEWGSFRALLPFPQNSDQPLAFTRSGGSEPTNILLLAGHGQAELNPPEWLETLQPQLLLADTTDSSSYSPIDTEVLVVLEGFSILSSADHGWVELSTDGEQMWIESER